MKFVLVSYLNYFLNNYDINDRTVPQLIIKTPARPSGTPQRSAAENARRQATSFTQYIAIAYLDKSRRYIRRCSCDSAFNNNAFYIRLSITSDPFYSFLSNFTVSIRYRYAVQHFCHPCYFLRHYCRGTCMLSVSFFRANHTDVVQLAVFRPALW